MTITEYIDGMAGIIRTTSAEYVKIEDVNGKASSADSKDFIIASAARITIRDYSNYDPDKCHDGGSYKTGVTFIRHADGWERREYTSGDYCPYCGSFDCCGDCEEALAAEAERLTDSEVMEEVDSCRGQADMAIMYQPA